MAVEVKVNSKSIALREVEGKGRKLSSYVLNLIAFLYLTQEEGMVKVEGSLESVRKAVESALKKAGERLLEVKVRKSRKKTTLRR